MVFQEIKFVSMFNMKIPEKDFVQFIKIIVVKYVVPTETANCILDTLCSSIFKVTDFPIVWQVKRGFDRDLIKYNLMVAFAIE